ncbi:ornithine cyclodeaminase family protein [Mariniluteicoccus endophyticus]
MRQLSAEEVLGALTAAQVIETQLFAYRNADTDRAKLIYGGGNAPDGQLLFAHGARIQGVGTAFKIGIQEPRNRARGLPSVQAVTVLQDADTGVPLAVLDGTMVTTLRTAGGVVAALQVLGHPTPDTSLAVLGAGPQGQAVVRLAREAWGITDVRMWSPSDPRIEAGLATVAESAEAAVRGASLVACCTSSTEPVIELGWLDSARVVATMGSYETGRDEVGTEVTLASSLVVVDQPVAYDDCGPVVAGWEAGLSRDRVVMMQDVLSGTPLPDGLRCFHSKGFGVQDAALAAAVHWGWDGFRNRIADLET